MLKNKTQESESNSSVIIICRARNYAALMHLEYSYLA